MKHPVEDNESTWAYVRTALVVFAYLASKAERQRGNLEAAVAAEMGSAEKQTIEKATLRMLEDLKIELLVPRIIEAVAQSFSDALQEAKWTKWLLYISQTFGIAGAGALLQNYDKLPAGSTWYLGIYVVGTIVGFFMLFVHGRQKVGK